MYISFFLHHGPQGSEDDPELVLTHTKQLLLVTFCDATAGELFFGHTDGRTDRHTEEEGQTDVEVEIVI